MLPPLPQRGVVRLYPLSATLPFFAYRSSSRLFRQRRLGSSWAGALRCAAVRLFIVLMCFWLLNSTACDVSPTHVVEFWPLSIFTGLFCGASCLCASLVALYFLRRVSCPRGYFEGVAFHGFPFGIQKVQRNANLVDLEKCSKMSIYLQKSASIQRRTSPPKFDQPALLPTPPWVT